MPNTGALSTEVVKKWLREPVCGMLTAVVVVLWWANGGLMIPPAIEVGTEGTG
jgi:hypothetical protein